MRPMKTVSGLSTLALLLCSAPFQVALPQEGPAGTNARYWVIEGLGTEKAVPNVFHIMMKMEYEAGRAADATAKGERRLREFLEAVDALKIPDLTYRVCNNCITPANRGYTAGIAYTRNIVFTLTNPQPGQPPLNRDAVIARLEDLGARYDSHCVTCIGSG